MITSGFSGSSHGVEKIGKSEYDSVFRSIPEIILQSSRSLIHLLIVLPIFPPAPHKVIFVIEKISHPFILFLSWTDYSPYIMRKIPSSDLYYFTRLYFSREALRAAIFSSDIL